MSLFSDEQIIFQWGEAYYPNGGYYNPRGTAYLNLCQLVKGSMEILLADQVFNTKSGDTVLICNEQAVDYRMGKGTHLLWCGVPLPPIPSILHKKIVDLPLVLKTTNRLEQLMDLGLQDFRHGNVEPTSFKNALGHAVMHEFFDAARLGLGNQSLPEIIERVKRFIEQHYTEEYNSKSICDYAGVSKSYLNNLFTKHIGLTPVKYLWRLRLNKGVHLLYYSGLRVSEIAYQCGFKNPYHFSRLVKQNYGASPSALRNTVITRQDLSGTGN